jgi:hypothetical protein
MRRFRWGWEVRGVAFSRYCVLGMVLNLVLGCAWSTYGMAGFKGGIQWDGRSVSGLGSHGMSLMIPSPCLSVKLVKHT